MGNKINIMTKEKLIKCNSIAHDIRHLEEDIDRLKRYQGNKWHISFGQDSSANYSLKSMDDETFDKILRVLKIAQISRLKNAQNKFKEL